MHHLRPVQFYGRLWFLLPRRARQSGPTPSQRCRSARWVPPVEHSQSLTGPTRFRFLAREEELSAVGWNGPIADKLWRYNQHYFDDLVAQDHGLRSDWHRALISRWIDENPPGRGTGWESYPTSLRIVNWIKWSLAGNNLSQEALSSLAVQARWLSRRLEWHLLGNHLWTNAKALVFAGLFFDGAEASSWLTKGAAIVVRQAAEQILPDGGHFELSPMYHALILEDMLDLINLGRSFGHDELARTLAQLVPRMLAWLDTMTHPDGDIALFNDSAFGIASATDELHRYASRMYLRSRAVSGRARHLRDSGYFRLSLGEFMLIGDVGNIGPDYQPGHAHADTLSFELSFGKQRVFVNSGISEYGASPERQRQRGSAAHNTVVVADENSSEVWSGFRVGRRARPLSVRVEDLGEILRAEAAHDGYRYLAGAPRVHRSFELVESSFTVADYVSQAVQAEARFHLHPAIDVVQLTMDDAAVILPNSQRLHLKLEGGPPAIVRTTWHPRFGATQPNLCLVLPLAKGRAKLTLTSD